MSTRIALYEINRKYLLTVDQQTQLETMAGLDQEPVHLAQTLARGAMLFAAALAGFSVILWIAANWDALGKFQQFGLIETAVIVASVGAWFLPIGRVPLCLVSLLTTGGLFAFFGQTYQTGADPWQLFALWSALTLPLCFAARSDIVWTPWVFVAATAISLWLRAHSVRQFIWDMPEPSVNLVAWFAMVCVWVLVHPVLHRWTGTGTWSSRLAFTVLVSGVAATGAGGLLSSSTLMMYWLSLLVVGGLLFALFKQQLFDIFCLSEVALAANVLIVFGVGRVLFTGSHSDFIAASFILGILATGLLATTVTFILRLFRQSNQSVSQA